MDELIIDIDNGDNYINKYNKNKLSEDLYNYILEEVKGFSFKKDILIKVYSNYELTPVEKDTFIDNLKNTVRAEIKENLLLQKYLYLKCFSLAGLGIIGILLYYTLSRETFSIISELFLIIGWVGIWESLYILLFDENSQKIKTKRYKQLEKAKVEFYCN